MSNEFLCAKAADLEKLLLVQKMLTKHAQEDARRSQVTHKEEVQRLQKAHDAERLRLTSDFENALALEKARQQEMLQIFLLSADALPVSTARARTSVEGQCNLPKDHHDITSKELLPTEIWLQHSMQDTITQSTRQDMPISGSSAEQIIVDHCCGSHSTNLATQVEPRMAQKLHYNVFLQPLETLTGIEQSTMQVLEEINRAANGAKHPKQDPKATCLDASCDGHGISPVGWLASFIYARGGSIKSKDVQQLYKLTRKLNPQLKQSIGKIRDFCEAYEFFIYCPPDSESTVAGLPATVYLSEAFCTMIASAQESHGAQSRTVTPLLVGSVTATQGDGSDSIQAFGANRKSYTAAAKAAPGLPVPMPDGTDVFSPSCSLSSDCEEYKRMRMLDTHAQQEVDSLSQDDFELIKVEDEAN
jgi:hypothetical protein